MASPVDDSYTAASGGTVAGGRTAVSGFAAGNTAGSYASNTWTPGRNGSGVVNAASWALVPSGQWSKVAGTSIFNMDAAVKAINPAWQDYGTSGADWDQTVTLWTGCAHDPSGARMWLPVPGGHAGSSNNGIYRFDGYKMAWAIEHMPSDPTPWSTSYKNNLGGTSSYTICSESGSAAVSAYNGSTLNAINGTAYDELFWGANEPTSRHTYHSVTYCPDRNEIAMICRRLWTYSIGSGTWNYKRLYNDELTSALPSSDVRSTNRFGEGAFVIYDEATHEVLGSAYGSSGFAESGAFNLNTKASWAAWTAPAGGWATGTMVRYGRNVTYVRQPGSGGGGVEYRVYNLDSRTNTVSGSSWTLGSGVGDFRNDLYQPSLIYVPSINRYWFCAYTNASADMVWHEIDPTTTPWTMNLKTFTGNVPTPPKAVGGSFCEPGNKHMFIPSMNAVIYFFRGGAETMYVYKF